MFRAGHNTLYLYASIGIVKHDGKGTPIFGSTGDLSYVDKRVKHLKKAKRDEQ